VTVKSTSICVVRRQCPLALLPLWPALVLLPIIVANPTFAKAQTAPYVILSKRAILVQDMCESNQNATLIPIGATSGGVTASVVSLREAAALPPNWTLVLLAGADLQADQ
jgi:hypothetical protein